MTTGIVVLTFGEPATTDRETIHSYLTRIFADNAGLDAADSEQSVQQRAQALARKRLDSLQADYEAIDGSPLTAQAQQQVDAIRTTLTERDHDVPVYHAMQYMEPLIPDLVPTLAADGIDRVIALPLYPLSGPSTTRAAIETLAAAIDDYTGYDPTLRSLAGWHRDPRYTQLRADAIDETLTEAGIELSSPDTALVFSAHGTPVKYLDAGSRYDQYVTEHAAMIAGRLGNAPYQIGYQNHTNRGVEWTTPETETVIEQLPADTEHVVVDPISFIHEQSETLVELDIELQEEIAAAGMTLHRVSVPHADDRLPVILADLIEPFLIDVDPAAYRLQPCQCHDTPGTYCPNAPCHSE